ncbi:MAG: B12-binding domain-containing radical SAM protein [Candidatus Omnitrophica bacterium]|jgi:magnesium-protoporphyrin IX monomethyl ester (oxidative) cyclase|nr:B12-binding domain-containing radical SAM protein [Candidatus Omnitrophota bacterium]
MKYKHALFLNPYIENHATSVMKLFPPTGLEYVATSAKSCVDKITLLDFRYEKELTNPVNLFEFIKREIDIICVTIGWDRQFKEICGLLSCMPEDIPLVVGGYKATEMTEELFKTCPPIKIIVRGEGEETIQEILKGVPLKNILGISYRENGTIIHNANRSLRDVEGIPAPDRALRNNEYRLSVNGINIMDLTFDSVLSARGCPYNCKFCTFNLNPLGQKRTYSARSVDSVIEELKTISAKVILFSDDNLFTDMKRAEELCDKIIENKIKKRFVAQARLEISKRPQLLEKMVKAGFKALLLGVESPHDRILAQLDKGFNSATIRNAFKVLTKYPIYYSGYFIYGNIGETKEEMLYIAQFAKEIGVDSIACNKLRIEKFSPLRSLAQNSPGYHITDRGEFYSDMYDYPALKKIGRTIKFSFYTPSRYLKILWKNIFVTKFFTFSEVLSLSIVIPRLLYATISREIKKGRLADSLKRTFISNNA